MPTIKAQPPPWHPRALPEPGFRFEHDGVTFEAVQAFPHPRSSYLNVFLIRWRTWCTGCNAELSTMSTAKGWHGLHRKQCAGCRSLPEGGRELLLDVHQFAKDSDDEWVSFEHDFNGYTDGTVKALQRLGLVEARIDADSFTVRLTDRGNAWLDALA